MFIFTELISNIKPIAMSDSGICEFKTHLEFENTSIKCEFEKKDKKDNYLYFEVYFDKISIEELDELFDAKKKEVNKINKILQSSKEISNEDVLFINKYLKLYERLNKKYIRNLLSMGCVDPEHIVAALPFYLGLIYFYHGQPIPQIEQNPVSPGTITEQNYYILLIEIMVLCSKKIKILQNRIEKKENEKLFYTYTYNRKILFEPNSPYFTISNQNFWFNEPTAISIKNDQDTFADPLFRSDKAYIRKENNKLSVSEEDIKNPGKVKVKEEDNKSCLIC